MADGLYHDVRDAILPLGVGKHLPADRAGPVFDVAVRGAGGGHGVGLRQRVGMVQLRDGTGLGLAAALTGACLLTLFILCGGLGHRPVAPVVPQRLGGHSLALLCEGSVLEISRVNRFSVSRAGGIQDLCRGLHGLFLRMALVVGAHALCGNGAVVLRPGVGGLAPLVAGGLHHGVRKRDLFGRCRIREYLPTLGAGPVSNAAVRGASGRHGVGLRQRVGMHRLAALHIHAAGDDRKRNGLLTVVIGIPLVASHRHSGKSTFSCVQDPEDQVQDRAVVGAVIVSDPDRAGLDIPAGQPGILAVDQGQAALIILDTQCQHAYARIVLRAEGQGDFLPGLGSLLGDDELGRGGRQRCGRICREKRCDHAQRQKRA